MDHFSSVGFLHSKLGLGPVKFNPGKREEDLMHVGNMRDKKLYIRVPPDFQRTDVCAYVTKISIGKDMVKTIERITPVKASQKDLMSTLVSLDAILRSGFPFDRMFHFEVNRKNNI